MKLVCCSFEKMKDDICRTGSRIVMFGAGVIGQVTAPEILKDYGLLENVDCYIDNNIGLQGTTINILGREYEIRSLDYLKECLEGTVVILNISRYADVYEQLSGMESTREMKCYIMPMMLIHNFCSSASEGEAIKAAEPLIPKKLHYMWLGRKSIPDKLKRCVESWRRFCPNYQIVEWNEDNYDIEKHPYMKQAYEVGAYGFVPDYARLDILYNEGGIYLDLDVEIKRSLDALLYQDAFCGVEKWQVINFGGLSGAIPGHPMVKKFLDARKNVEFFEKDGTQNRRTCGFYDTRVALGAGYRMDGKVQSIGGMTIYPYDYFHPYDYMSGIVNKTDNTYSVHWFNGGWLNDEMKRINEESRMNYVKLYNEALMENKNTPASRGSI